jgi:hypothetical protein
MRCPKCGYISFDYLKQCPQCQTDWAGEKLKLNLLDIKPDPISVQELKERSLQQKRDDKSEYQGTQLAQAYKKATGADSVQKKEPDGNQTTKISRPIAPAIEISMDDIDMEPLMGKKIKPEK